MEMPIAVTGHQFFLWLHISLAVIGLGVTFAGAVLLPVAMRMDPRHLPFVHRIQLVITRFIASPALLLLLLTGIYLVSSGHWEFSETWISASFLILFVLGGIFGGYFIPTDRKLERMVTAEIKAAGEGPVKLSKEYLAKLKVEGIMGGVVSALILIVIWLMVTHPGA